MFKKLTAYLGSLLLTLNIFCTSTSATTLAKPPAPSADSAVLMNAVTGEILYSKNPDGAYAPASTTKVLTTLLTLENCKLDDIVTVDQKSSQAEGSSIYLLPGEQVTVRDVLFGLNLQSGNDCAEALAVHMAGSVEKFAAMMNTRAKELGCNNSNFVNPSGLYDKNHKTSARDLALILKELTKHPEYFQIASTLTHIIEPNNKSLEKRYIWNKNKLVQPGNKYYYKGAIAGKTGYTTESQHSYVAVAERDGQTLIVTLVHDSTTDYYKDTISLFDYGFKNFKTNNLFNKNDTLTNYALENEVSIPVVASDSFFYCTTADSDSKATYNLKLNEETLKNTSIKKGDKIGSADITLDGKAIGCVDVFSGTDHQIKPSPVLSLISMQSDDKSASVVLYIIYTLLAIVLILFGIRTYNLRIKKLLHRLRLKRKRADN